MVMIETAVHRRVVHGLVRDARRRGMSIGFVPTMGALHEGHMALVRAARAATGFVIVSIFVNPLQFGPNEDLAKYPRPLDKDRAMLEAAGADVLYLPSVGDMYPPASQTRVVQSSLTQVLCGASRPGHFDGVLTVVAKLFAQVRPDVAFFGRKDYQQTVVLRRMVADLDLDLDLDVRVCDTVREPDGLAMSSRNAFLSASERAAAPALKRGLDAARALFVSGETDVAKLIAAGRAVIDATLAFTLQYFEICHPDTLVSRTASARAGDVVAVAARLGTTRLIDNIPL